MFRQVLHPVRHDALDHQNTTARSQCVTRAPKDADRIGVTPVVQHTFEQDGIHRSGQGIKKVAGHHGHTPRHTCIGQMRVCVLDGMLQVEQHATYTGTCAQHFRKQLAVTATQVRVTVTKSRQGFYLADAYGIEA